MKTQTLALVLSVSALFISSVSAQQIGDPQVSGVGMPPSQDDGPVLGFSIPSMPANPMQSLHDPSVLKDLEIVDEQRVNLRAIQVKFDTRFQTLVNKAMNAAFDPTNQAPLKKEFSDFQRERTMALSAVLLPHQLERLQQIRQQNSIASLGGVAAAICRGGLAEELAVTDKQKEKLQDIQIELRKEIDVKIRECREAAKRKALAALTVGQREQLKTMVGEEFSRKHSDWLTEYGDQSRTKSRSMRSEDTKKN